MNNPNFLSNVQCISTNDNPLTSPGEGFTVFTSPYLSAGAPALGEAKGLNIYKPNINLKLINFLIILINFKIWIIQK